MRLRKIRIYQGLTQDELRQLSGVALKTITNIEREKHLPKLETMLKIAKALSVDLTDIDEFKQRIAAYSESSPSSGLALWIAAAWACFTLFK